MKPHAQKKISFMCVKWTMKRKKMFEDSEVEVKEEMEKVVCGPSVLLQSG